MTRAQQIQQLDQEYDLLIIGAGASGLGAALDAALRGLKVLVVDTGDFGSQTSSKSTKLIHGGVRYLEQAFRNFDFAQLRQVKHGLRERHFLLQNAPHLAHPLLLVTPVNTWISGLYFTIGLKIYSWFGIGDSLPPSRWLSKAETMALLPNLNQKMHSAVQYSDGQFDDARYCVALASSAAAQGATVLNYFQVIDFQEIKHYDKNENNLQSIVLKDTLSGNEYIVRSKTVLNCTGFHSDSIRLMANPDATPRMRLSKGVHIVLPSEILSPNAALLIPKTPDGRVVFAIPYQNYTMLGTTDDEVQQADNEPFVLDTEVEYLLETLAPYIQKQPKKSDVKAAFAGYRPLVNISKDRNSKSLLRDHSVETDNKSGLVSLMGGKWTTYRLMAKDAVDTIEHILFSTINPCITEKHLLHGAAQYDFELWRTFVKNFPIAADTAQHLMRNYGSKAIDVAMLLRENQAWANRLIDTQPFIAAEVVYAVRHEQCCTPRDFCARRIRLELLDWNATLQIIDTVVSIMQQELNWSAGMAQQSNVEYKNVIQYFQKGIEKVLV
jgi:glycerol-3-phosphate dehydrogenase